MRLLLVEDALDYARLVLGHLGRAGLLVDHVPDLAGVRAALTTVAYDLVVLDRRLPDGDSLAALPRIRAARPGVRVLMLTALDGAADRVGGLDAGADDYVVKPVPMPELVARIRASLRRPGAPAPEPLTCGALSFDPEAREARIAGVRLVLQRRQIALLQMLVERAGRLVPRETLEAAVYAADDEVQPNALDVQVSRLRRKLQAAGADATIHTVRGVGYMLDAP